MKTRFIAPTLTLFISMAPLIASAADLRVGVTRYDGGAAIYGMSDNQQLICDSCPQSPDLVPAAPRPAIRFDPVEETQQQQLVISEIPKEECHIQEAKAFVVVAPHVTVYFNFNNASLSGQEKKKIRTALAAGVDPSVVVRVDGYTCRVGSSAYNRKLSSRRAKAVAAYLRTLGVKVSSVEGLGKKNPKGGALSKDRRAEIVVKERNYIP